MSSSNSVQVDTQYTTILLVNYRFILLKLQENEYWESIFNNVIQFIYEIERFT